MTEPVRCPWATSPMLMTYHDDEWGVPVHDDRRLFEFLILEGAQAGLSWETVLRKREGYRRAFEGFDPALVATFGEERIGELIADPSIIRHRGKVAAAVTNARAVLEVQSAAGSLDHYLWSFVDGQPIVNRPAGRDDVPATSVISERMSRELRRRGFAFVGSTILYAFMQAVGMVDDHLVTCFRSQ